MIDNTFIRNSERETTGSEGTKATWWTFSLRPQLHTLLLLVKTHIRKHILIYYKVHTHVFLCMYLHLIFMFLLSLTWTKSSFQKFMKRVAFPDFSSPVEVLGFTLDHVNLSLSSGLSSRPLGFLESKILPPSSLRSWIRYATQSCHRLPSVSSGLGLQY